MAVVHKRQDMQHDQDLWDKFWKDKYGNIVVWQRPNTLLIAWVILTLISLFLTGVASDVVWWLALADLAVWSLLQIVRGVNYLYRLIGLIVLLLIVMAVFKVGY